MTFHRRRRFTPALAAASVAFVAATTAGCMADNAVDSQFTPVEAEPTGIRMPKFDSPELPEAAAPTHTAERNDEPCAIDDVTLAACLDYITDVVGASPNTAIAATETGHLWRVTPGTPPVQLAELGIGIKQLLASPTVVEDGQVFVLLNDGTINRLTLLPGGGHTIQDFSEANPETLGIYFDPRRGEPTRLLAGDPDIQFQAFCHNPLPLPDMPPLATVILDGRPQLVQWSGGLLEPIGGIDLDNSIAGCAVAGDKVVVAIPDAQRVVAIGIEPNDDPVGLPSWQVSSSPEVLVDGEFGHVESVAAVFSAQGIEVWGGTANKAPVRVGTGHTPGNKDDRVFRMRLAGIDLESKD